MAASAPAFDERLPKYLDDASQGANRATNLARRLLTFSKGGAPIKQPLEVAEILTHAVLLALSGSKLKPRFAFQRDLYPVIGDPVQLTQVIENVVINACEATPQRGRLLVRAENVDERIPASSGLPAGRYVRIEIEDRGTGIPESIRHRISEAFFTTKPGGSGLGLATVNSIMQQHGGSITIESRVGRGTTVSLMLPAAAHRPDNGYVRARADGNPFAAVLLDGTIPNGLAGEEALKLLLEARLQERTKSKFEAPLPNAVFRSSPQSVGLKQASGQCVIKTKGLTVKSLQEYHLSS